MEQPEDPTQTQTPASDLTPPTDPTPVLDPALPANPEPVDTSTAEDDLAAVRSLILLAYPDVVPELIRGETIAELQAAVEPARAAYRQVAERIAGAPVAAPPSVPAGAAGATPPIDGLPPSELIKRGLQRRG